MKYWNYIELEILNKIYSTSTDTELCNSFPNRNIGSIRCKARKLGLERTSCYYEPTFPHLADIEKAYIAGLFDGEGCIHISLNKLSSRAKHRYHKLEIIIANTNKEILHYLFSTFGGRITQNSIRKNQQTCFSWRMSTKEACAFLKIIYPYLKIKKQQADIAIHFQSEIQYTGKVISTDIYNKRELSRNLLIKLKGKHLRL